MVIVVLTVLFLWGRDRSGLFDWDYTVDHDIFGSFGDFLGGTIGTWVAVLAAYLMFWTFRAQRELNDKSEMAQKDMSDKSINQAELQRFNDMFFSLLERYKELRLDLQELTQSDGDLQSNNTSSFFDKKSMELLSEHIGEHTIYGRCVNTAKDRYLSLYFNHSHVLSPVFRTLYRIIDLLEKYNLPDRDRKMYVKIIRAQLSEGELFFLRYNAMTVYGQNFQDYINKYHLLKHLPIMSLLEFKYFRKKLSVGNEDIFHRLNLIFHTIWQTLSKATLSQSYPFEQVVWGTKGRDRHVVTLYMDNPTSTVISIERNSNRKYTMKTLKPLAKLSNQDILDLFRNFLKEVYSYSNFGLFNGKPNYTSWIVRESNDSIIFYAKASAQSALRISHPAWDKNYGIAT